MKMTDGRDGHSYPILEGYMQHMMNECFRCKKEPYETNETHWHYCNDCVKVCVSCKELKVLWAFNFDFSSEEWKRWHKTGGYGKTAASGHLDVCAQCERNALDAIKPKLTDDQLLLMMRSTLRKGAVPLTGATEPPDTSEGGEQRQLDL